MKKLTLICVCGTLAGCGGGSDPEPAQAASEATDTQAMPVAADGAPAPGRYRAVDDTGLILIEVLRADGTYSFFDEADILLEEGTYEQKSPAELCFVANTPDASETCYDEVVGDDGVWRSTNQDTGVSATIERSGD